MSKVTLYKGDCLDRLKLIEDKSVNLILCDLPYGTSACPWDEIVPFGPMWNEIRRVCKEDGAAVLFASQPFTSKLIYSNLPDYKYSWIWEKDNASNFLNKRYQPGKITEDICVFGWKAVSYSKNGNMKYFPQLSEGKAYTQKSGKQKNDYGNSTARSPIKQVVTENSGTRLPNNILKFARDKDKVHPTQKLVALLEYLIKTYTSEGDTVLDFTMGSGSTGVAAVNTKRDFIGIELDDGYFGIAEKRIYEALEKWSEPNEKSSSSDDASKQKSRWEFGI